MFKVPSTLLLKLVLWLEFVINFTLSDVLTGVFGIWNGVLNVWDEVFDIQDLRTSNLCVTSNEIF